MNIKKIIIINFFLIPILSSADYQFKVKEPIISEVVQNTVINPEFWTYTNINLDGFHPAYSDASSSTAGGADFNFGQKPFLGNPNGYTPYDSNYNPNLWSGGNFVTDTNIIKPPNLNTARYQKSYTSGKYYFEATISGAHADQIGFINTSSTRISYDSSGVYLGYIGYYRGYVYKGIGNSSVRWDNGYNISSGDTVQFYIDFDNDRILMKKLNTEISDHINYVQ